MPRFPSFPPNFLFLMGGPGVGKGTQSALLTREFGSPNLNSLIPSSSDSVALPPAVFSLLAEEFPTVDHRQADGNSRLFHLSVGALLRRESLKSPAISSMLSAGRIVPGSISVSLLEAEIFSLTRRLQEISAFRPIFLIDGFPRNEQNVESFKQSELFRQSPSLPVIFLEASDLTLRSRILQRSQAAQRSDDSPEIIERRINTFHQESFPVLEKIQRSNGVGVLHRVDGEPGIAEVYRKVREKFLLVKKSMATEKQEKKRE